MDRRERERILGQWGGRRANESIRERREAEAVARELELSGLKGEPLRRRVRNFRPAADSYIASLGGPLPYMQRLRAIEEETADHEALLEHAWRTLAAECAADAEAFALRWRRAAEYWNFSAVNDLIDRHNRYFPIEARLPMDLRTRDFALVNGKPYRRRRLDARWVLEAFPPVLADALG